MATKQKEKLEIIPITREEAYGILEIKGGADVYGYGLAGTLRGMQRRGLPVNGDGKEFDNALFTITKSANPPHGAKQQPYFGAIASGYGIKVAKAILNA